MKTPFIHFLAVAGLWTGIYVPCGSAQVNDDFNDGNDAGWTRYQPLAPFGAPGTFSFPSGGYRIQAASSPDAASLGPGRAGSFRPGNIQSGSSFDFSFDVLAWDPSVSQTFGGMVKVTSLGRGTTDGYAFGWSTAGFLSISRFDNEQITPLSTAALILNPTRTYRFIFTGMGSGVLGRVYDRMNLGTALDAINAVDATYSSGSFGLFVVNNTGVGGADATFDNIQTDIPEPSTTSFLLLAGALLMSWCSLARGRKKHGRTRKA
jgi:hypothetical protein